jgi:hypothetical protein
MPYPSYSSVSGIEDIIGQYATGSFGRCLSFIIRAI